MKLSQKIAIGFTLVAIAGIVAYISRRSYHTKRMLNQIADEGYETANDVLFPGKNLSDKNLHYGPVIPG